MLKYFRHIILFISILISINNISYSQVLGDKILIGAIAGCSDADAQLFIDEVGITDETQQDAICQLVIDLKTAGVWSKSFAIYPFVGSTESEQKWQLKDPRDLDAAYRLNFIGAWTHSITGAQMDLSTVTASTFFNPDALMTATDAGLTVAARSNTTNNQLALGNGGTSITVLSRTTLVGGRVATATFTGSTPTVGVAEGVATITRTGTTQNAYKDSVLEGGPATVSGSTFLSTVISFGQSDKMEFCFGIIHEGLTATEVADTHTAIDTYSDTFTGRKNW